MTSNPLQIVDVSLVDSATGDHLVDAATTQGFVFVEGHDFTQKEVDILFETAEEFFGLLEEEKNEVIRTNNNHGYVGYENENLDPTSQKKGDPKEALNFSNLNCSTGLSSEAVHSFFNEDRMPIIQSAVKKFWALNLRLLRLLAIGLKIEDLSECPGVEWFDSKHDPTKDMGTTFRFLHYIGQKKLNAASEIRAGAHTDYGALTLLLQRENQEGLEIRTLEGWEAVPYIPTNEKKFPGMAPPIIVNIADQLSYWSAGLLKSTIHRVKFPKSAQETGQDRYSIVFFCHPNDEALLTPFPSPLTRGIEGRGSNAREVPLSAGEHLQNRLRATY